MNASILFLTPDDNSILEFIKLSLENMLEEIQIDVYGARVEAQAFKIIEKNEINLIIADMDYEGIESYEFYDKLKKEEQIPKIPFIFLSSEIEDQGIALLKNLNNFFVKPLNEEKLIKKIYEILEIEEKAERERKNQILLEIENLNCEITQLLDEVKALTQKVQQKTILLQMNQEAENNK